VILQSAKLTALPGLRHAFSTRLGGVSIGPYATMNLGRSVGDDPAAVAENLRRFAHLAQIEAPVFQASQVHGCSILGVEDGVDPEKLRPIEADALFTKAPRAALGIRTADCAPLLFAAQVPDGAVAAVAAVHAGWRGATQGIVEATVRRFASAGFAPQALTVALGPTIGPSAFEVGPEVIEAARRSLSGDSPPGFTSSSGRPHLDLPGLLVRQLERLSVPAERIELVGGCTSENQAMYFSHRRDHGTTGRHLSAIAFGHRE
jgi:YfiH family protein